MADDSATSKPARARPTPPARRARAAARGRTARARLGKAESETIFQRFQAQRPEPKGELEFLNPFTLLVAVVLSAQATDAGVNKATRPLFEKADRPEKMLALGEAAVSQAIRTIGLFNTKAKNV